MNTHDPRDDESLPGEDALKALYRSLPRKEPGPALDQAVRRMAAAAAHAPPHRRVPRWPLSVASAAVLVVAAGLGWRLYQQPSSVPTLPSASTVSAIAPSPVAAAASAPPLNAVNPPAMQAQAVAPQAEPSPAPTTPRQAARKAKAPTALAEPHPPVARAVPPPTPMAPAPALPVLEQSSAPVSVRAAPVVPVQAYAPPPAPAPPAPPASGADEHALAAPAPAPMTFARPATPVVDPTALNAADSPAQELAKIRQLFAQQRRDEALSRLAAFRQAHPDLAIPDDLRAQEPDHE